MAKKPLPEVKIKRASSMAERPLPEVKTKGAPSAAKRPLLEVKIKRASSAAKRPLPEVKIKGARSVAKRPLPEVKIKGARSPAARPLLEVRTRGARTAAQRPLPDVKMKGAPSVAARPLPEVRTKGASSLARKVAWVAGNIFLLLTILTLTFFLLAPRLFDLKFFTVIGGSMEPTIPLGSVVAIRPVAASDIQVADIIMYGGPETSRATPSVIHRVVAVESSAEGKPTFITRGDNNGSEDYLVVYPEDVVGRVWFHIPFLGYIRGYGQTQPLFLALVGIPAVALMGMETAGLVAYVRKTRGEGQRSNGRGIPEGPIHPEQSRQRTNRARTPCPSGKLSLGCPRRSSRRLPQPHQAPAHRRGRPNQKVQKVRTG